MKIGQCLKLKHMTTDGGIEIGWVTRVYTDGSFRVSYADKGGRWTYPASSASLFKVIA